MFGINCLQIVRGLVVLICSRKNRLIFCEGGLHLE